MHLSTSPRTLRAVLRNHAYLIYFLLLTVLTLLLLGFFLRTSFRQTEQAIALSSANEAHVLASQMEAALRRIEATSELIAFHLFQEARDERFSPQVISRASTHLQSLCRSFPEILGHRAYDAAGQLVFTSDPTASPHSIADQPFLAQIRHQPGQGLFFSETLPTTPLTVNAYRAVLGREGTFQGLIVTPIDLRFFEQLFAQIDVGREGMISIRRSDTSHLVVRWPELMTRLNNPAKDIPPQQQIERGVDQGVVRYVGRTDGIDRIFAFHRVAPYPFYVLVGRAATEQFAGWRQMAVISSGLTMSGLLLLGLFLFRLHRSQQRLRRSEHQYQAIVESQHDAVCRWLPDTTLTFANSKYLELFASADEPTLVGRPWIELVPDRERAKFQQSLAPLLETATPVAREIATRGADGTVRQIHWVDVPLVDGNGRCIEVQSVGRDITDLRQAEAEQKRLHLQLAHAQKMEAIGTLAGGIAHDFNNILGAIIGYTEMALDASPPHSTLAHDLDKVLKASQRAVALVKQILAFSRQSENERSALAPAIVLKEALQLLRPTLPTTIAIEEQIDDSTDTIQGDPVQFHQMVMNLCTNAFHAMEQSGGVLTIGLVNRVIQTEEIVECLDLKPGRYVELLVRDTGVGIAPEILNKIFEPYFTTKEMGKGTGMGLAIIHGIVTASRGCITCASEPGAGTTFRILLPAFGPEDSGETERPVPAMTGRERVLFVDDEPLLASLGKTMLERLGYGVTVCTDSVEALSLFRNDPKRFDLVITDQTMPGMTGMELAAQMLQIRPEVAVILCTGYSSLVSEDKALALGIRGFAFKPLTQKEISILIRRVLDSLPL
jgi:PAS domain S-box-containing protein